MKIDNANLTTGKFFDSTTPIWFGYGQNKPTYTFTSVPWISSTFVENDYRKKLFVNKDSLSLFKAPSSTATGLSAIGGSLNFRECNNLDTIELENLEGMEYAYMDNLSALTMVKILSCDFHTIYLKDCDVLNDFRVIKTNINDFSFGSLPSLQVLQLSENNKIQKLDISNYNSLLEFYCNFNNNLTEINLKNCNSLIDVECNNNNLNKIDISGSKMFYLNLDNNNFGSANKTTVDIIGLTALSGVGDKNFYVRNCNMTVANLSSLFNSLPPKGGLSGTWTIYFKGNIGTADVPTSIPLSKGWAINKTL